MPINRRILAAAVLVVPSVYASGASAALVDLFDDPSGSPGQSVTSNAVGSTDFDEYPATGAAPSTGILGGYRDLIVEVTGYTDPDLVDNSSDMVVRNGSLQFINGVGVQSVGTVQWDGNDDSATLNPIGLRDTAGSGVDLVNQEGCAQTGCDRFTTEVIFTDVGLSYTIGLYTDSGNYATLTAEALFSVPSRIIESFPFEWFTRSTGDYVADGLPFSINSVGAGPDLNNIGALELVVFSKEGTTAVDLGLGYIEKGPGGPFPPVVPEPGTLALLGLGVLGFAVGGRRRKLVRS